MIRIFFKLFLLVITISFLGLILSRLLVLLHPRLRVYSLDTSPLRRVAIVFGAGLRRDGTPTPVLRDRIETAVQLFVDGKVEKILMSGDNRFENYNEPGAMREYAMQLGVPPEAIVLDYAGRSTYETCYRAKEIFEVPNAILVTQSFHLPRALYTCNNLGVEAVGVSADRRIYRSSSLFFWNLREVPASAKAFWDVHFGKPLPVLGKPEPIFPLEAH